RPTSSLGSAEVKAYLNHLALTSKVSASTQNQAFAALLLFYRDVLSRPIEGLDDTVRAKLPIRLPLVLTREETAAILRHVHGVPWLMLSLMYGAGLRLLEATRL